MRFSFTHMLLNWYIVLPVIFYPIAHFNSIISHIFISHSRLEEQQLKQGSFHLLCIIAVTELEFCF